MPVVCGDGVIGSSRVVLLGVLCTGRGVCNLVVGAFNVCINGG